MPIKVSCIPRKVIKTGQHRRMGRDAPFSISRTRCVWQMVTGHTKFVSGVLVYVGVACRCSQAVEFLHDVLGWSAIGTAPATYHRRRLPDGVLSGAAEHRVGLVGIVEECIQLFR